MGRKNLNKAHADMIVKRREMVASLRLKGLSLRQITEALAKGDRDGNGRMVNPSTDEPFDVATIHEDLEYLKGEWAANAARSTDEFIAEDLAELIELKKWAWKTNKGELVLRCQERRAKLLGLDKPTQHDVTSGGQPIKGYIGVSPDDWDKAEVKPE
jgi:hypothetical protein